MLRSPGLKRQQQQQTDVPGQLLQATLVLSLGREDPLEEGLATHSSVAWGIPWTEEPGGYKSIGSKRVGHDWATKHACSSIIT